MDPRTTDRITLVGLMYLGGLILLFNLLWFDGSGADPAFGIFIFIPYLVSLLFFLPWHIKSLLFLFRRRTEIITSTILIPGTRFSYYFTIVLLVLNLGGITLSLLIMFDVLKMPF